MDAPSDRSKTDRKAKASQASEPLNLREASSEQTDSESARVTPKSEQALPRPRLRSRPPADVKDWDLPGIKKRPSLAPPAPPPSHAPPPPTTHELFDVETAAVDYERERASRRAALRASARPHPPRPTQKSISDANADDGGQARISAPGDDPAQRLSTPLSWAAAKDPPFEEIPADLLEPVADSAPLALPPVASSEPLASAIPSGSVVAPSPSTPPKKRSGAVAAATLGVAGLLAVGWLVSSRDGSGREARVPSAERAEPAAASEHATSEANPALRVPLPPLELDIGVPVSQPLASASPSASVRTDASSVPPVAPKGILPQKPNQPPTEELPPFDSAAATAALNQAAGSISTCRQEGDPTGSATVIVRYAPSGRVTSSTVEAGPFAGTVTGGCIATTFRKARVPAFSGDYVTVKKTVSIR